jgi:hypothetical protein
MGSKGRHVAIASTAWIAMMSSSLGIPPTAVGTASAAPPPYVTILFSRSQWSVQEGCVVPPGAVTLGTVAADLARRGWAGTGSVVTSRIGTTDVRCSWNALYPTWTMLQRLHSSYRWTATSHSATYPNLTLITRDRQFAESCGTLPTFTDHGFGRAWGMFSYPNDDRSLEIQRDVVSTCFAFGRRYSPKPNQLSTMAAPWWGNIRSVNGGACHVESAQCYSVSTRYRYQNPFEIQSFVAVSAGQWAVAQLHKLVTGAKLTGTVRWDCTSADWRLHFTNQTEVYCWNDYQRILFGIPTGAVVTDPATVARSWGANPQVLGKHP